MVKLCYICGAEGKTREHVPPLSFFPKGFRKDLWTVRACAEHNLGYSKDVEYVRNVVVSHQKCKGAAHELAQSAAFRSFERRASLFFQTFRRIRTTAIERDAVATIQLELPRFERVMKTIACGIYCRETDTTYVGDWHILSPSLILNAERTSASVNWPTAWEFVSKLPFIPIATPESAVFQYRRHVFNDKFAVAYAFEFYGGFHVYVWSTGFED